MIDGTDRVSAIQNLLAKFDLAGFAGKRTAVKANYNSSDAFPASTHIDTLRAIMQNLNGAGADRIVLAERSGMGDTRRVLEETGVFRLAEEAGFDVVVLDELPAEGWVQIIDERLHWSRGFKLAGAFAEAERVVQTCCLKTHRFGGHFTMSLKNSVGMVADRDPSGSYEYMGELHSSQFQRQMIAEINKFYKVDIVVMDATEAFVRDGPERGELVKPNLMLASKDRVALDVVGVAVLRSYGSTPEVMKGRISGLEQISRAAELGVGISTASQIKLVPLDSTSQKTAENLQTILDREG